MQTRTNHSVSVIILTLLLAICPAKMWAVGSQNVTMTVGEKKTLYLPSSITSLNLKGTPQFYSNSTEHVVITSYSPYSVTVEAKKAWTSKVIVRCDYTYYIRSGFYTYAKVDAYDFYITVNDINCTRIELPEEVSLEVGKSKVLTPTLTPSNATNALTWESSAYYIVNVDQNGRILAQQEGQSVVTVKTSNGKSASCLVTAYRPTIEVTSVSVQPTSLTLNVGDKSSITATISPSNATDKSFTWSSSSAAVTVDRSGNIEAVKAGTATIKATATNGKSGSCVVTVREVTPSITISDTDGVTSLPTKANVTYTRKFMSGWNSVCFPFNLTLDMLYQHDKDSKLAIVKEVEVIGICRQIALKNVDYVAAGTPCLVYFPKETTCTFTLSNATLVDAPTVSGYMVGTFCKKVVGSGYYKLSNDGSSLSITKTDKAIVYPFRAYFKIN